MERDCFVSGSRELPAPVNRLGVDCYFSLGKKKLGLLCLDLYSFCKLGLAEIVSNAGIEKDLSPSLDVVGKELVPVSVLILK